MQFGSNEQISKFHLLTATPTIALPDFLALGGSSAAVVRRRGVNAVLRKKACSRCRSQTIAGLSCRIGVRRHDALAGDRGFVTREKSILSARISR